MNYITILDWTVVILTVIGLVVPASILAIVAYQRRSLRAVISYSYNRLHENTVSFSTMWGSVAMLVGMLYVSERYGMTMTYELTLALTFVYMALGVILWVAKIAELFITFCRR